MQETDIDERVPGSNRDGLPCVMIRYLWPFWMFENASCGSMFERAAAYRHNRERRHFLPAYLVKWACIFGLAIAGIRAAEAMSRAFLGISVDIQLIYELLACAAGIVAAAALIVEIVIAVLFIFFSQWKH